MRYTCALLMLCASSALAHNARFVATAYPSSYSRHKENTTEAHSTSRVSAAEPTSPLPSAQSSVDERAEIAARRQNSTLLSCSKSATAETSDAKIFVPVERAAEGVRSATQVGVNVGQFSQKLQQYATEVNLLHPTTQQEKCIGSMYALVLDHYKTSLNTWNLKINGICCLSRKESAPFVEVYGTPRSLKVDDLIPLIWRKASEQLDMANAASKTLSASPSSPTVRAAP
jgi:hypothetical protein